MTQEKREQDPKRGLNAAYWDDLFGPRPEEDQGQDAREDAEAGSPEATQEEVVGQVEEEDQDASSPQEETVPPEPPRERPEGQPTVVHLKRWTKEERAQEKGSWIGPPGPGTRNKFGRLPNWISHAGLTKTLTKAEARLYILLVQAASNGGQGHRDIEQGESYPSITTLAHWAGLHRSTVIAAIGSLEIKGAITSRKTLWRNGQWKSVYRVIADETERPPARSGSENEPPSLTGRRERTRKSLVAQ